jgi:hypothetical protein
MASPGPWTVYNEFKETLGKKTVDLVNDTFKVALFTSTSNAAAQRCDGAVCDAHESGRRGERIHHNWEPA